VSHEISSPSAIRDSYPDNGLFSIIEILAVKAIQRLDEVNRILPVSLWNVKTNFY